MLRLFEIIGIAVIFTMFKRIVLSVFIICFISFHNVESGRLSHMYAFKQTLLSLVAWLTLHFKVHIYILISYCFTMGIEHVRLVASPNAPRFDLQQDNMIYIYIIGIYDNYSL